MSRSLTAVLLCLPAAAWADWPMFRGPNGSGKYADAQPLPTRWSDTENIAWKTPLPGRGSSSPVVFEDRVVLTAFTGYGQDETAPGEQAGLKLHVLCFDRNSGRQLWDRELPASDDERPFKGQVTNHGYATPTPCVDETGPVVSFGVSGLYAFDWDGNELWRADVGRKTSGFGSSSSPVFVRDMVVLNASIEGGDMFSLNRQTGELRWRAEGIKRSWSVPVLADEADPPTLVLDQKEEITGFDPETGEQLWTCYGVQDYIVPVPVLGKLDGNTIAYCMGGRQNHAIAVRLGGTGDVTDTHRLWDVKIGANVTSPVLLTASELNAESDRLFTATDRGIAHAIEARTGETVFKTRLPTRSRVYASVVYGDGKLYAQTRDAGITVFRPGDEDEEIAVNVLEAGELFNAGPALDRGQILIRSDRFLYCVGESAQ